MTVGSGRPAAAAGARAVGGGRCPADVPPRDAGWTLESLRGQYSDGNAHADLYRYLHRWLPVDAYLNIGYSGPGERHLHPASPVRLVDRIASPLLDLHGVSGGLTDGRRLVDIGSGRGGPAIHAWRRYGLEVIGVDITPHNVARAEENARAAGAWPRVRFCLGSALALPLADASVSLAWSIESPAHFPDKPRFLGEVARVIRPGGVFALADLLVVEARATASARHRRVYEEFLAMWDVPYLESREGYRRALAGAGFELRRAEIVTAHNLDIFRRLCAIFLGLFRLTPLYLAYRTWVRRTTGADLAHVYRHVLASHRALRLGMIDYGLFWALRR